MELTRFRIGWHADRLCPAIASIRLRLLQPLAYLRACGLAIEAYDGKAGPGAYDLLIFSKSLSPEALSIARAARAAGTPVVYDLCDNIFAGKDGPANLRRAGILVQMLRLADHLVFSTPVLAGQIAERVPDLRAERRIIPDPIEPDRADHPLTWRDRIGLLRLRWFLRRHRNALRCVWFGKSQGDKAGLPHVHAAVRELERCGRPVTLTIIGNRPRRYRRQSRGWRVPHHHVTWSLGLFGRALRMHQVALIPVQRNSYTEGKTINRPATAMLNGLGVIADSIPSYEELRPFIVLDDWQGGLDRYSRVPPARDEALAAGRAYLQERYSAQRVGAMWLDLLRDALGPARSGTGAAAALADAKEAS